MRSAVVLLVLCASTLQAQVVISTIPFLPNPIKDYLQLSDSQYQTLLSNNSQFRDWSTTQQSHIFRLQYEISQETARDNPDALSLGIRYVDIEKTCRDIQTQTAATLKKNTDLLTAPQKVKLQALSDAIKLAPVITDGQNSNLLPDSGTSGTFLLGSIRLANAWFVAPMAGCSRPIVIPTALERASNTRSETKPQ